MKRLTLALVAALLLTSDLLAGNLVARHLQDVSVTVIAPLKGTGSGFLVNREVNGEVVTFVWTAAHVVEKLRSTETKEVDGVPLTTTVFKDADIYCEYRDNGKVIDLAYTPAKVIRYSGLKAHDLAILEIRKRNFTSLHKTTTFYHSEVVPEPGTELYHVGSLRGIYGSNSLTTGIVSQTDRKLATVPFYFDQVSTTAFPGSSGGGVFLKEDGRCIGMLVRSRNETFNFIVPVRRMKTWAAEVNATWALDPAEPLPDGYDSHPIEIDAK